jgi:GNAT superfamily N-acetyltransferase
VVREEYQGMGIASYLLSVLEKIALENNYTQFSAAVLRENKAMIQVFRKRYPNLKMSVQNGNEVLIEMDLNDAVEFQEAPD